jgi:hypothetical protein
MPRSRSAISTCHPNRERFARPGGVYWIDCSALHREIVTLRLRPSRKRGGFEIAIATGMRPPSRTLRRTMMLVAAGTVGCGPYRTTSDYEIMSNVIAMANAESRERAVSRTLASRGATPVTVSEQTLTVPSEVEECASGHADLPPVTVSRPLGSYVVDCTAMADLARGRKPIDARTSEGRPVVLIASRTAANDKIVIARDHEDHLVAILPTLEITQRHEMRQPGTCHRMPSPPMMPRFVIVLALDNRLARDIDIVPTTYQGERVDPVCDHYVE